jgi:multisubunit Na+/H+ antiporter MnhG subunit
MIRARATLPMNLDVFARFFVRFNGLCFVFWALHSLFDFPQVYTNYSIAKETGISGSILAREFYVFAGKFTLEILAAALLLARTNHVITFILTGQWRPGPTKPPAN